MLEALQSSKFLLGILMLFSNIWGRHIVDEISTNEEEYRRNIIIRRLAIFAVCFAATRDIITSIFLTAGFIILATGISRRGQEGMANPEPVPAADPNDPRVGQPAYDTSVPPLFK